MNLFSRRCKPFDHHYPLIVEALGELPEGTVVDGEIVALDDSCRPDFNRLQNFRSEAQHIHYFIFDILVFDGEVPLAHVGIHEGLLLGPAFRLFAFKLAVSMTLNLGATFSAPALVAYSATKSRCKSLCRRV